MQPDPATRERLRSLLLARGQVLATQLADVMAGNTSEAALESLGLPEHPGDQPADRVRRALDQVESRRMLLDAGDDAFGRCGICGIDLGAAAVEQMPWADRCQPHAAL